MSTLAPIIVFTYNRCKTTMETMFALKDNILAKESEVFVFSDGPKAEKESDEKEIKKLRTQIKTFAPFFKRFELIERENNVGINKNIIPAITDIINRYGKAIIIEDDILTARNFLSFMNQALEYYEKDKDVFSICGYNPTTEKCKLPGDSFGYDVFWCWGWATWADRWNTFNENDKPQFQMDHIKAHSEGILFASIAKYSVLCPRNKLEALWDYKVACRQLASKKTVIYPKKSICDNIGMDGTGLTAGENEGYVNNNFDIDDTNESFVLSKEKLNVNTDTDYYFKFRWDTYALKIFFHSLYNREWLYSNMYHGLSELHFKGESIGIFFRDKNITDAAIYGWSEAGELLYDLLKKDGIKVSFALDRRSFDDEDRLEIYNSFEKLPETQMIIVSAIKDFNFIEENLMKYVNCPIVSMDDIVVYCLQRTMGFF